MELNGKYTTAKIFTDVVDDGSIKQIQQMCDSEIFANTKIRIMPDVHAGQSCTIGTTIRLADKVIPNMVGVDIGCGMETIELGMVDIDLARLDALIYERIPSGTNHRHTPHEYASKIDLSSLKCYSKINPYLAYNSIGTLGGGNHFIEVDKDDDGCLYLVIHSGSRHLGSEVCEYYQTEGYRELSGGSERQINAMIAEYKAEGRYKEINDKIKEMKSLEAPIDPEMAYLEGELLDDYIHDMKIVQRFAMLNRQAMAHEILDGMSLEALDSFTTIHNYIDTDKMILRKGAVSAQRDEKLLIPINMRDGSLVCIGKGNEEWNCSAPHGAGRLLSRGRARATLDLEEYQRQMQGIYTTSVNKSTLDESPMAYKSIDDIVNNIAPTVEIVKQIKPIYNFKASE